MKNLKKIRIENQMTQDELARILKVDKSTVSKWETTDSIPTISKLKKISEIYNVSYDVLLREN